MRLRRDRAEPGAALRKKNVKCDCDCDWAEPCAALRKKVIACGCDCDWAEPCAALRKKSMNTASKLGPHTQTDRGTCPGVRL